MNKKLLLGLCSLALSACAAPVQRTFFVPRPPAEVFRAAEASFPVVSFGVSNSNRAEGFISGSQAQAMGEGNVTTLSVRVSPQNGGSSVDVAVVPPPGAVGNIEGIANDFEESLRQKVKTRTR